MPLQSSPNSKHSLTGSSENILAVSSEIKQVTIIQSSNCTPGHLSQRSENLHFHKNLHMYVHSSFIHNSQKLQSAQMSFSKWVVKPMVIHSYSEPLSNTKESAIDKCTNLDDSPGNYADWKRLPTVWFRLYITFLKWQYFRNREQMHSCQGFGMG